jgi:hypothetical protein
MGIVFKIFSRPTFEVFLTIVTERPVLDVAFISTTKAQITLFVGVASSQSLEWFMG